MNLYKEFKQVLMLGGVPGWMLLGYYVVQIAFARTKSDMAAVDGTGCYLCCLCFRGWNILLSRLNQRHL